MEIHSTLQVKVSWLNKKLLPVSLIVHQILCFIISSISFSLKGRGWRRHNAYQWFQKYALILSIKIHIKHNLKDTPYKAANKNLLYRFRCLKVLVEFFTNMLALVHDLDKNWLYVCFILHWAGKANSSESSF